MKNAIIAFCSVVLLIVFVSSVSYGQNLPKRNHEISMDSAKHFIKNLEKDAFQMKVKGGMFSRDVIDKILSQKDVVGIRYYYAKMDDGTPTLVLVGVDSNGKDMVSGTIAEKTYPCPPYCDETTSITK